MVTSLIKIFTFEAAHFLPKVPKDHKCRRMHGHSFKCEIEITGEIDDNSGWVTDFSNIKKIYSPVRSELDHYLLNDIPGLENPTSEVLCQWIWKRIKPSLPMLSSVTIHETCTSKCVYRGK